MQKLQEIRRATRRSFSSTWILKAAVLDPKCIIICAFGHDRSLKKRYLELSGQQDCDYPVFINTELPIEEYPKEKLPIIFDNSCFSDYEDDFLRQNLYIRREDLKIPEYNMRELKEKIGHNFHIKP
ncbi:MAG: hypothetical protein IPP05_21955 [Cytophagaceae bacterium]|nr:hypothetical protein [Cytophagaceae bacterium]